MGRAPQPSGWVSLGPSPWRGYTAGTNGGHRLCPLVQGGAQQSRQPSVIGLGSQGAVHLVLVTLGVCRPALPVGSFMGSHFLDVSVMALRCQALCSPVGGHSQGSCFLIYYTVSNLQGVPGCRQECVGNVSLMGSECCVCIL